MLTRTSPVLSDGTKVSDLIFPDTREVQMRVLSDREIYELEMEKIFGKIWVFLGHESEIPNSGDFKTTYIGDTSIIVTRDEDGSINALVNKCGHRGARVCRAASGATTDFTCLYHQWNYDLKGNLLGVPFRRGVAEMVSTNNRTQLGTLATIVLEMDKATQTKLVYADVAGTGYKFPQVLAEQIALNNIVVKGGTPAQVQEFFALFDRPPAYQPVLSAR